MPLIGSLPGLTDVHVAAEPAGVPAVGFVELKMYPNPSPVRHSCAEGHATAPRPCVDSPVFTDHAAEPPVGFVEVRTSPASSVATHKDADAHETALRAFEWMSMCATVHAGAPPAGSVEVTTFPASSTATHRLVLGQAIPRIVAVPSTVAAVHGPAVGVADVAT
jgi:hypothetical protein